MGFVGFVEHAMLTAGEKRQTIIKGGKRKRLPVFAGHALNPDFKDLMAAKKEPAEAG